jgi:hypothetical protein
MIAGFSSCGWHGGQADVGCTRNGRGAPGSSHGPCPPWKRLQTLRVVGLSALQRAELREQRRQRGLVDPRCAVTYGISASATNFIEMYVRRNMWPVTCFGSGGSPRRSRRSLARDSRDAPGVTPYRRARQG